MPEDPFSAAFGIEALIGLAAAGTGVAAVSALSRPAAPVAPTQTQTQTQQAESAQAAAAAQANALSKRRGMASTVLTSPMGINSAPQTQHSTLGA